MFLRSDWSFSCEDESTETSAFILNWPFSEAFWILSNKLFTLSSASDIWESSICTPADFSSLRVLSWFKAFWYSFNFDTALDTPESSPLVLTSIITGLEACCFCWINVSRIVTASCAPLIDILTVPSSFLNWSRLLFACWIWFSISVRLVVLKSKSNLRFSLPSPFNVSTAFFAFSTTLSNPLSFVTRLSDVTLVEATVLT